MAKRLDDKVVLVTGASSGIGMEMCRDFARRGAHVVLAARRTDRLQAIAAEIERGGTRALAVECDVTRDGDLEAATARARSELGPIHVAVANAGFGIMGRVDRLTLDDFRRQFETNVFGVLRTIRSTLDDLVATRGRLALMGSVSGHVGLPTTAPYAMSKFALRALAECLRPELRPLGVSVTLVSPGFVDSEIRRVDNQGAFDSRRKDPVPGWLVMPTAKCARKAVRAILGGRREIVITGHGKVAVWFARHFPCLVAFVVARAFPADRPRHRP